MIRLCRPLAAALFLATASALAQTHVVLLPQASTLLPGRSLTFRVQLAFGGDGWPALGGTRTDVSMPREGWYWSLLDGGVGALEPRTGVYTAPFVDQPRLVKIQVRCQAWQDLAADAVVLVLPQEPFDVVGKVLGPDWVAPFRGDLPFLDPHTDLRQGEDRIHGFHLDPPSVTTFYGGWGLPLTLRWRSLLGTQAQQLHLWTGPEALRRDVTGRDTEELIPTGILERFTVESLQRAPGRAHTWWSLQQSHPIRLRGLFPFAGNAVAGPDLADGTGVAARFLEPFGLASIVEGRAGALKRKGFLVSDADGHVVRRVSPGGEVRTLWGRPGEAGHQDALPVGFLAQVADTVGCRKPDRKTSRFHRPTFLAMHRYALPDGTRTWWCAVADSGNHVVRVLYPDGTTRTLAGVPGLAGHRDGKPALFNDPQGMAVDAQGNVYVADRGNQVIRVIRTDREVETVAGWPGEPGTRDGQGLLARFKALGGLALSQGNQPTRLYLVDGHALRCLTLPDGDVATLVGSVDTPGFKEIHGGTREERAGALLAPCLQGPCGLLARQGQVDLADQGNHAVRRFDTQALTLTTLAGDPRTPSLRWGLARDGLEVPLDDHYATLDAPRTLTDAPQDGLLVATGPCLAVLLPSMAGRDRLGPLVLTCPPARASEPCVARFVLETRAPNGDLSERPIHYTVEFLEADGTLSQRLRGTGVSSAPVAAVGALHLRGEGRVVVRCVSDQGVSAGAQVRVQVQ